MATTRPWVDGSDDAALIAGHAAGKSLHGIAAELGVAKTTAKRKADAAGLSWDRTKTAAATVAHAVDAKARRLGIIHRMYDEVEAILDGVEKGRDGKGWTTILKGSFGVEEAKVLTFIPSRDRRDAADTISRYTDRAVRLEQVDNNGSEAIRGLLGGLADQLGLTPPDA